MKTTPTTGGEALPEPLEGVSLPVMLSAFRTTEVQGSFDPEKQRFRMIFNFPDLEALHTADDEWMALIGLLSAPSSSGLASGAQQSSVGVIGETLSATASTVSEHGSSAKTTATTDAQAAMDAMRVELEIVRAEGKLACELAERAFAEIATLKALQPVAVERVMELADNYAQALNTADLSNIEVWRSEDYRGMRAYERDAAREALRTELTKGQE